MDPSLLCQGKGLVLSNLSIDEIAKRVRFLLISLPNNAMSLKSPFTIHKALKGIGGEPKSVKRLRSGDLLVETSSSTQTKEARKLILPQISQTYSQATKSSTTTTTTQTDDSITKIVCLPLKLLQPLTAVSKPTMPSKIPTVTKSSASTEAQLLPTTSSAAATSSESQPPAPFDITTSSASISLITSTTTMFTALSNKMHPSALETTTSNSISSTITSPVFQASKQKSRRKKRNPKTVCNVTAPTVKPKIEIKMAPHKPRKSSPIQDTDDKDMIVYDMEEQIETPKKKNDKYFLSEEYWKNESWRQEGFLHVMTPTRVRNSQK
ncbi:uncharacterized protein TNCV_2213651 [Trichonephila clavipes]|nr:uncharacterized protein TNCV_2213651 [Trichonephila clavipes]